MKRMREEDRKDIVIFLKKLIVFFVFAFIVFRFIFGICQIDHDLYVYDRLDHSYPTGEMVLYEQNDRTDLGEIVPKTMPNSQEGEVQIVQKNSQEECVLPRSSILGKAILSMHKY